VPPAFDIPRATVEFRADQFGEVDVTAIIPLYNYTYYIGKALKSVRTQTIPRLDLVVFDDASIDTSLQVAAAWAQRDANRFNRILVVRNETNPDLARSRNTVFDAPETPFVLPLEADNRLRPACCPTLLDTLHESRAGFASSILQCSGAAEHVIGTEPFALMRFASSNYIDAMALVAKWCWTKVGGYTHIDHG
jgi:glycosyltransferase involved in cell wall biosynthesis